DLMATCVDLAGTSYPTEFNGHPIKPMRGQSLRPLLTGKGKFPERTLYWEHEGNAALRAGDQKLVRLGSKGRWELFNLRADRTEQMDLAADNSETVKLLAQQWESWAKSVNAIPKPPSKKKKAGQKKNKNKKAAQKKQDNQQAQPGKSIATESSRLDCS
ncbi:MAG: hypothetical protein VX438_17760, partial [Planctomycetota bacterium]|nr:hypothetical protein [Planctomycetota bacterium]